MAINLANNNSLANITALPSSISGGAMTLLATQTASSSATISFTSGIDDTYDSYVFKFYDIHPATNRAIFQFQADTGTNTNYNIAATTTYFQAYHKENDGNAVLGYNESHDDAQSTSFLNLTTHNSNDNDSAISGNITIYQPSSSVFVKHFISNFNHMYTETGGDKYSWEDFKAGYFNTATALTRFQFKFDSGNIDSGVIKLYGIS
jgi:hypothetical protein